ncbi:hypothetical protein VTJ83DRAFT_5702 [Remersonia thermophila]|uniref:Uncharacterized protein n=1 Tax=Remersonia thermophila TaxID=72144 RepID=A0ABR4D7K5_9PEZI
MPLKRRRESRTSYQSNPRSDPSSPSEVDIESYNSFEYDDSDDPGDECNVDGYTHEEPHQHLAEMGPSEEPRDQTSFTRHRVRFERPSGRTTNHTAVKIADRTTGRLRRESEGSRRWDAFDNPFSLDADHQTNKAMTVFNRPRPAERRPDSRPPPAGRLRSSSPMGRWLGCPPQTGGWPGSYPPEGAWTGDPPPTQGRPSGSWPAGGWPAGPPQTGRWPNDYPLTREWPRGTPPREGWPGGYMPTEGWPAGPPPPGIDPDLHTGLFGPLSQPSTRVHARDAPPSWGGPAYAPAPWRRPGYSDPTRVGPYDSFSAWDKAGYPPPVRDQGSGLRYANPWIDRSLAPSPPPTSADSSTGSREDPAAVNGRGPRLPDQARDEADNTPADLVLDPSQGGKDMALRVDMDIQEDWSEDLELFCRLKRLGLIKEAKEHFRSSLGHLRNIPYLRVQYAEMLLFAGYYKEFQDLEFVSPGNEIADGHSQEKLAANYALLDLLSQRPISNYIDGAWQVVRSTLKSLRADCLIGSTEVQLLTLCLRVLHRIELYSNERIVRPAKPCAKHLFDWPQVYRKLVAETCIWDFKDLFIAAVFTFGWEDTVTQFFGTSNPLQIVETLLKDWSRPVFDESSLMGLLDLLTSLILYNHIDTYNNSTKHRSLLLLRYATALADTIKHGDTNLMKTRPFVQWLLAKSILAMKPPLAPAETLESRGILKLNLGGGIDLPICVPSRIGLRPDWNELAYQSDQEQEHAIEVAIRVAEKIGDHNLHADALKLLILQSENPEPWVVKLANLQLDVQGDRDGYIATCLSSYLLPNPTSEGADLLRRVVQPIQPRDGLNVRQCENSTLHWATIMFGLLLLPLDDDAESRPSMKAFLGLDGTTLPPYITQFVSSVLRVPVSESKRSLPVDDLQPQNKKGKEKANPGPSDPLHSRFEPRDRRYSETRDKPGLRDPPEFDARYLLRRFSNDREAPVASGSAEDDFSMPETPWTAFDDQPPNPFRNVRHPEVQVNGRPSDWYENHRSSARVDRERSGEPQSSTRASVRERQHSNNFGSWEGMEPEGIGGLRRRWTHESEGRNSSGPASMPFRREKNTGEHRTEDAPPAAPAAPNPRRRSKEVESERGLETPEVAETDEVINLCFSGEFVTNHDVQIVVQDKNKPNKFKVIRLQKETPTSNPAPEGPAQKQPASSTANPDKAEKFRPFTPKAESRNTRRASEDSVFVETGNPRGPRASEEDGPTTIRRPSRRSTVEDVDEKDDRPPRSSSAGNEAKKTADGRPEMDSSKSAKPNRANTSAEPISRSQESRPVRSTSQVTGAGSREQEEEEEDTETAANPMPQAAEPTPKPQRAPKIEPGQTSEDTAISANDAAIVSLSLSKPQGPKGKEADRPPSWLASRETMSTTPIATSSSSGRETATNLQLAQQGTTSQNAVVLVPVPVYLAGEPPCLPTGPDGAQIIFASIMACVPSQPQASLAEEDSRAVSSSSGVVEITDEEDIEPRDLNNDSNNNDNIRSSGDGGGSDSSWRRSDYEIGIPDSGSEGNSYRQRLQEKNGRGVEKRELGDVDDVPDEDESDTEDESGGAKIEKHSLLERVDTSC